MAGQGSFIDDAEQRARWDDFAWTAANAKTAKTLIARYPAGRQRSAVMALLANLAFKIGLVVSIGGGKLARHALPGLFAIGSGMAAGLLLV